MSLQTTQHIGEHPTGNAVTAPNDPAAQKASTARALQAYGVIEAFRQGSYPSNRQIDETLGHVLDNSPIDKKKLSRDGKMLIQDFQNIIRTAKTIVDVKNEDELFQNFLYHTRQVDYEKANLKNKVDAPISKGEAQNDGEQAVEHLRTLGKLIFTNSEARKLLKDIGILGRDVAADAAAKVADTARPADHELNNVDEPAPSNQWVGPDGETRGHNDAVPDTGLQGKKEQLQNKKEELKQQAADEKDESQRRVEEAGRNAQQPHQTEDEQARAAAQASKEQSKEEASHKKNKLINAIPDEHKDKAKEQLQNAKDYARDKFPEERRDRFIYRLKKVVVENQRHRDFQEAIEFFLDRAERYHAVGKDVAVQTKETAKDQRGDSAFQQAETELRTLLERFANGQSSQPIFDAVNQLYTDTQNDPELRRWFSELDSYVRQVLQEPGYIMKDQSDRDGRALLDKGKAFWDPKTGKYAGHKDAVFDTISDFFRAYADDELNVQLGEDVKKLTKDLLMDSDGNLTYKPQLWNDLRRVILPAITKKIGLIPIPRAEYTDDKVDIVIENLTLDAQNILPNIVEIEARNYFKISPYDNISSNSKHSFTIGFSQIQSDIKDVAFYIRKKTGFPKIKDSGFADVVISGKGISGKIQLETTGRKDHAFNVVDVKITIDKLKFAVKDSKYSFLISTLRPLITGIVKKAVAKAIQEAIRAALVQVDAQLADISEKYEAAKRDGNNPLDAAKIAYSEKKEEGEHAKAKAEEKAPDGKFQITGKRDSKLVNWSSKHSAVEQQGEKQDLASKQHHGWKSPAFDIVGRNAVNKPMLGGGNNATHHTGEGVDSRAYAGKSTPGQQHTSDSSSPTHAANYGQSGTTGYGTDPVHSQSGEAYNTGHAVSHGAAGATANSSGYNTSGTTAADGYPTVSSTVNNAQAVRPLGS